MLVVHEQKATHQNKELETRSQMKAFESLQAVGSHKLKFQAALQKDTISIGSESTYLSNSNMHF